MARKTEQDEYLEQLWYLKEDGKASIEDLKSAMNGELDLKAVDELSRCGLVNVSSGDARISLTDKGHAQASRLIRAHRLAERLLHDVLGGEFEQGACEFEHTVSLELVDSICTLLGHPRECPHGMPIPEGECCSRSSKTALCFIVPLTSLKPGQAARIAYINCQNDQQVHKLDGLCLRPGAVVKLHQNYPTYVIECECATIALDQGVAANICVWKDPHSLAEASEKKVCVAKKSDKGPLKVILSYFKRRKD